MKMIEKRKCEVTVKRPNGQIETVVHPKIDYMLPALFEQMKKAMRDAGRGEPLSYKNIDTVFEMEDKDCKTTCARCGTTLDIRKDWKQKEWIKFGGNKVQVDAYYCQPCKSLLTAIGRGEVSEIESRQNDITSGELVTKNDF